MSRINCIGVNPINDSEVDVSYGWDEVPGFKPGYFFQVFSRDPKDIEADGEGLIVNEGFLSGISKDQLKDLAKKYKVRLRQDI